MITLRIHYDIPDTAAWRYHNKNYCPFCLLDTIVIIHIASPHPDATASDDLVINLATGTAEAVALAPDTRCDLCAAPLPLDKATIIHRATDLADKLAPGPAPDTPDPT